MDDKNGSGNQPLGGEIKPEKLNQERHKGEQVKKEHKNYANKMWQNIQKANSEKNRQDLKKDVSDKGNQQPKQDQPKQKQDQPKQKQEQPKPKQDQPKQRQDQPRQRQDQLKQRQDQPRPKQEQPKQEQPKQEQPKPRQEQPKAEPIQPKPEVVQSKVEPIQPKTEVVQPKSEQVVKPINPFAAPQAAQAQSWNTPVPKPDAPKFVPTPKPTTAPINPFAPAAQAPQANVPPSFTSKAPEPFKNNFGPKPEVAPASAPVKKEAGPFENFDSSSVPKAPQAVQAPPVNPFSKSYDTIDAEVVAKKTSAPKIQEIKEDVKVVEVKQEKGNFKDEAFVAPVAEIKKDIEADLPASDRGAEVEEFKNELFHILEQAGITKGTLVSIVVFIFVIILAIVGFNNGWHTAIINLFKGSPTQVVQTVKRPDTTVTTPQVQPQTIPAIQTGELVLSPYGVISAYIFGLEYKPNLPINAVPMNTWGSDVGVKAANAFGVINDERKIKFIEYVELLRKLQNIYNTDVYALLDMSTDRRTALQQHLNDLGALLEQAASAYNDIDLQLQLLQTQYDPIIAQKDASEKNFFNALYSFYGENAYVYLGMFTKFHQDAVAMKAYFNSYKALRDLFITYINALRPRYSDISANTEALVKGVHIFYVPRSDIKTIITLGQ